MNTLALLGYQFAGMLAGGVAFFFLWVGCEKCLHDGKGRTQNGHIASLCLLLGGTVFALICGAMAGGVLYSVSLV